jgi:hypothetical protein
VIRATAFVHLAPDTASDAVDRLVEATRRAADELGVRAVDAAPTTANAYLVLLDVVALVASVGEVALRVLVDRRAGSPSLSGEGAGDRRAQLGDVGADCTSQPATWARLMFTTANVGAYETLAWMYRSLGIELDDDLPRG